MGARQGVALSTVRLDPFVRTVGRRGGLGTSVTWRIIEADCVEAMKEMDEASVDAIVTDPPYGLEFMGKEWDRFQTSGEAWSDKRTTSPDWNGRPQHRQSTAYPRATKKRCRTCGKQEFSGSPCTCDTPDWEVIASQPRQLRAFQAWSQAWATEALRVLKPGGFLLAFGGTRTYHRLACAVEDAGFEIRDSVIWLYGSGFPKSLDVSKAIDRAAGAEREERIDERWIERYPNGPKGNTETQTIYGGGDGLPRREEPITTSAPATPEAQRWQGWGTALKPAHEPIVVARKPLIGTVAQTVSEFGTGALNIDGCRIEGSKPHREVVKQQENEWDGDGPWKSSGVGSGESSEGRWPSNVALSHLPECERVGERRVKSPAPFKRETAVDSNYFGADKELGHNPRPYADPDGLETVEAWRCAPGCAVAELDRQSGELKGGAGGRDNRPSTSKNGYGPGDEDGWSGNWHRRGEHYGDIGGASRFFLTVQPDTLCVLCGLPCVTGAGNPSLPTEAPSDTAPSDAQGSLPPDDEASKGRPSTPVLPAESSLRTTSATAASTAPSDASPLDSSRSDLSVRSVRHPCRRCTTAIAQSVARLQEGQTPESAVGPVSMPERRKRILSRSLAFVAASRESIDITTTTDFLSELLGYAVGATTSPIPASATASDSDLSASSSPSRAKYCAKSSRAERNAGLEGFEERDGGAYAAGKGMPGRTQVDGEWVQTGTWEEPNRKARQNVHPTVKPVDLMRWLCRLVTPPEGTILDPFAGSGTTGIAAVLEDFDFIGIEREPEYVEIAKARIAWWDTHKDRAEEILALSSKSERERAEHEAAGQMGLLG